MSGLHEGFAEIVADVPVYGDLDRAIEQAERERRHRYGAVAGLAAAAAVLAVIAGIVAGSRGTDTAPPVSPIPTPAPTSTETPDIPTPMVNGRITSVQEHLDMEASDYQWRAFDSASDKGLYVSGGPGARLRTLTVAGPGGPVSTLTCSKTLPCPAGEDWSSYAATLGPGADEVTVESGDRTLQVIAYDGTVRRTLDLTASLSLGDDITKLSWSSDGLSLAVATALDVWLVENDNVTPWPSAGRIWNLGGWSPDGESLLVDRYAGQTGADVVVLRQMSLGSPTTTPQTLYRSDRHFDWAGNLAWSPDGTRIAVRTRSSIVEISAEDGSVLARHPHIGGWLVWPSAEDDGP